MLEAVDCDIVFEDFVDALAALHGGDGHGGGTIRVVKLGRHIGWVESRAGVEWSREA